MNALLLAGPPDWPEEFPVGFGLLLPANPGFEGRVARWEAHDGRLEAFDQVEEEDLGNVLQQEPDEAVGPDL